MVSKIPDHIDGWCSIKSYMAYNICKGWYKYMRQAIWMYQEFFWIFVYVLSVKAQCVDTWVFIFPYV